MAYPLRENMSAEQFREEILEFYFPTLCSGEDSTFADDYAAIGAFLTRNNDVLRNLIPLENRLRGLALENLKNHANDFSGESAPKGSYDLKEVKTKILTRALQEVEGREGFNQATVGLLHDSATIGTGAGAEVNMLHTGRTTKGKREQAEDANLPAGAPTIIGGIHATDFLVLLKHGYAFKDVGAESAHGEFTHRLQWNAIFQAKVELGLKNEPIKLYKKMWLKSTMATANVGHNLKLYMWAALLDNLPSADEASNFGTIAWTNTTFNGPEKMTAELTRKIYGEDKEQFDNPSNLYVLRKLLIARQGKRNRTYDASEKYHAKKMIKTGASKTILAGGAEAKLTHLNELNNVVVWLNTL
jgi:hypothetical protein